MRKLIALGLLAGVIAMGAPAEASSVALNASCCSRLRRFMSCHLGPMPHVRADIACPDAPAPVRECRSDG